MLKRLIKTWHLLGQSIYEGERRERNLRTIAAIALTLQLPSIIGFVCYINTPMRSLAIGCLFYFFTNLVNFYLAAIKKDRESVVKLGLVLVYIASTNISIFAKNGFAGNWTLLFPLIICYLFSVRAGIVFSSYMTILHMILYWTPLRSYFTWYTPVYLDRFPFIYLTITLNTAYIMSEYHLNILEQQEYEKKLEAAKDAAEAANRAKSDFLASMSHEIRTPLNAVLGMNTMVLRESQQAAARIDSEESSPQNPEIREFLERTISYSDNIESAGNNLLDIINEILDFSKIEAGKIELTNEDYKLSSVLNDINNMITLRAKSKGLDFQVEVDESMPNFYCGDEMRVRLIMQNLLTNAVKYTEKGCVKLSVRMADDNLEIKPGEMLALKFSVEDTGIGIKSEDIAKLFKRFERVNLVHNSTIEGTGLGLAITKRLCDMMDGDIKVESEYGKGSVFTAVIHQKLVSREPIWNFREKIEADLKTKREQQEMFTAPNAEILVVDDTKFNLIVAVGLLKYTRAKIDTASGGMEAVSLAGAKSYDLILMDQRMPIMDGTEALKKIREFDEKTPVICVTADAVLGARARYLAQGFTDYLTKPIDSFELGKMLLKYLPENKIIKTENNNNQANDDSVKNNAGTSKEEASQFIDFETGLRYSQGNEDLYGALLKEFISGSKIKMKSLQNFYDANDYENYEITIHALKSSSKTIGAADFSSVCAELERATGNRNDAVIRDKHALMLELYKNLVETIKASRPNLYDGSEEAEENGDEILEFLPDSGSRPATGSRPLTSGN